MPDPKQRSIKEDPYHKDQFTYDEDNDCYYCPRGQTLPFLRNSRKRGEWVRIYRASRLVCKECPALGVCTKNRRKGRALELGPYDAVSRRHRAWMETEEAKRVYKLRKQLVEPVFGIIKEPAGSAEVPVARPCQRVGRMDGVGHSIQLAHPLEGMELPIPRLC